MIQRIQSLYLLFAAVCSLGLIHTFNLWANKVGNTYYALDLFNENDLTLKIIPILFIISGLLSIVSVFMFKKRKNQFVVNRLNILVNFILLGVLIYHLLTLSGESQVSEKGIGAFLPIVVIVLLAIANKAIKKDEDLVKSVDRLR
ncbi:DUF4293 domain-containing protein [Aureibaculum sp. 2210JD6-5]|uniref:DUF4293 domain-containing protein n=1 Tax=Aureibaculum sp. 2210JD6-5 TaxID=3103957 RepID=UPI002AACF85E|nr:DUF4293 domain-containing protein [Aureibaculum sp. 2210JD6-5]MDY7394448.1 DUF4293 domain-containing protein [Aureibaculum sp. 2210JD6-5]